MADNSNKIGEAIQTAIKNEIGDSVSIKIKVEGQESVASLNDEIGKLSGSFSKIGSNTKGLRLFLQAEKVDFYSTIAARFPIAPPQDCNKYIFLSITP